MLAHHGSYRWSHTAGASGILSLFAFSPPPSLHVQNDDSNIPTTHHTSSRCTSLVLNVNDATTTGGGNGRIACPLRADARPLGTKRPRSGHRQSLPSGLRGGSSDSGNGGGSEVPEPVEGSLQSKKSSTADTEVTPGSAQEPLPHLQPATPPSFPVEGTTGDLLTATPPTTENFGVALVTERSTATGGSKGLVSYSLLPDGSLKVGPRGDRHDSERQEKSRASWGTQQSKPPAEAPIDPVDVPGAGLLQKEGLPAQQQQQPRNALQALKRNSKRWQAGAQSIVKGAEHEAKAAAAAAGRLATGVAVAIRGGLMNTFLPSGYPDSVRPEYLRYRSWDIIQDLSSHLRGVLATQAVLEGMGVGRAGSTPLAATLQWMARDGASMIGGLLFTSAASANFGVNIKTWRLFADASNDVGLALEMLAPLPAFRQSGRFLQLICVASVFKAACGVAGGATGAAITEHWAVANNIADIGAKNGAQHTVASLLGLGLSVWFARAVSQAGSASGTRVWGWYIALTAVHLLANYAAMRTLALRSMNPARASLLVGEYLQQMLKRGSRTNQREGENSAGTDWMGRDLDLDGIDRDVLSPSRAARREKIMLLPGWLRSLRPWGNILQINVGAPVRSLAREADDLLWLTSLYHEERVMVQVNVSYKPLGPRMGTIVNVALREDASPEDRLQAMFQANLIHRLLVRNPDNIPQGGDPVDRTLFLRRVTEDALGVTRREFPAFKKALICEGWDLSRVTLGGGPWVGRWGSLAVNKDK